MLDLKQPIVAFSILCALTAPISPMVSWACLVIVILSMFKITTKSKKKRHEVTNADIMKFKIEKYSFHKPVHALAEIFGDKPRPADYIEDFEDMGRNLVKSVFEHYYEGVDYTKHIDVRTYVAFGSGDTLTQDYVPLTDKGQRTVQILALTISKAQGKKMFIADED